MNRKGTSKITNYQQLILLSINKILTECAWSYKPGASGG